MLGLEGLRADHALPGQGHLGGKAGRDSPDVRLQPLPDLDSELVGPGVQVPLEPEEAVRASAP